MSCIIEEHIIEQLPSDWDALFLGYHGGVLRGTGPGGKDTEQEHARAEFELQIDQMRGMDDFHGAVVPSSDQHVPALRMYSPLYGFSFKNTLASYEHLRTKRDVQGVALAVF